MSDETREIDEIIPPSEPDPLSAPETTKEALKGLGVEILITIRDFITLIITTIMTEISEQLMAQLEGAASSVTLRENFKIIQNLANSLYSYKTMIDPYIKYFDIFPEAKKIILSVEDFLDNSIAEVTTRMEAIERLSYFQDFVSNHVNELNDRIIDYLSFRRFLDDMIKKIENNQQ